MHYIQGDAKVDKGLVLLKERRLYEQVVDLYLEAEIEIDRPYSKYDQTGTRIHDCKGENVLDEK